MLSNWVRYARGAALGIVLVAAATAGASAQTLKLGVTRGALSVDPHFSSTLPIYEQTGNVFEPLVRFDADNNIVPVLAESWEQIDETTLDFKIRENVFWHDGQPLTAADVAFTYERARDVPNSPSPLTNYLRQITETEVIDDHTLRVYTDGPAPTLLNFLVSVLIVSEHIGADSTTEDYHTGAAMVGTGPYKFVSWSVNDNVIIEKNPDYWGEEALWDRVEIYAMTNDATRIAALLAGDIDVAMGIPPQDVEQLRNDDRVSIFGRPANRIAYMPLDTRDLALDTGNLTGPNGERLTENPLADPRVREALKIAIDTDAIVERVYRGLAISTGQYLQPHMFGYMHDLEKWQYDEARARELLEEAGWADNFKINLTTSESSFRLAVESVQAIAQFWNRAGAITEVTIVPHPVLLELRANHRLPVFIAAWTNPAGRAEDVYLNILNSRPNHPYDNPEVNRLILEGLQILDDEERLAQFLEAGRIAMEDGIVIPLWSASEMFATRKGLVYEARGDGLMMVHHVHLEQ